MSPPPTVRLGILLRIEFCLEVASASSNAGITASPPINITALARKIKANTVFTSVFCMKLGDIAMIYPFMKRDDRKQ
jgi:hypothetical protein